MSASQDPHCCPCEESAAAEVQLTEKPHCTLFSFQDSIPVSTSLLGDTSDTTSTGLAQRLGTYPWRLQERPDGASLCDGIVRRVTLEVNLYVKI